MRQSIAPWRRSLLLLLALTLQACQEPQAKRSDAPSPRDTEESSTTAPAASDNGLPAAAAGASTATTFTGTLRGGHIAIGAETTGWTLIGDGQTGGLIVDVSKAEADAQALDGKRVKVTGKMTTRNWPESGPTQILVADNLVAAEAEESGEDRQ